MNTKKIAQLSLLLAMNVVIDSIQIPTPMPNLFIKFTFLISMLVASEYDYLTVFIYSILLDVIGATVFPHGAFFFGYTLTSILSCSIYYFFLHKEVKLLNVVLAKTCVNLFANVLLNSVWTHMLIGKAYILAVSSSIVKNITLLPVEILLFMFFYSAIKPVINKYRQK